MSDTSRHDKTNAAVPEEPWFQDGLRFTCTRCGKCCTGEPGFVWVDDQELQAIADVLGEPVDEVRDLYTRIFWHRQTLREKGNGDCIFYDHDKGCTIYEVRPRQCRTWPFWNSNLRSKKTWQHTTKICPGSGGGELIPAEEIVRRMKVIDI